MQKPWVQIAIDVKTIELARKYAQVAIQAGADWIEAGTPIITYQGMRGIEAIVEAAQGRPVVADFKASDGVYKYFCSAAEMGASKAVVLGTAADGSIIEAVRAGKDHGVEVIVDMFSMDHSRLSSRAKEVEAMGANYVMLHLGFDELKHDPSRKTLAGLEKLVGAVNIPVGIATFNKDEAVEAIKMGASWVVQGEPLLSAPDGERKLREYIEAVKCIS